jgi:xylose isomerase
MTCFAHIPPVRYEGPASSNPLAYRYYDKDRLVLGRRMADHLRWAVCYWHTFHWPGSDVFGGGTFERPWLPGQPVTPARAAAKMDAAFDFFTRLGAPFFCFHDVDAMPEFATPAEYVENLAATVDAMERKIAASGVQLLWGTANLFGHPRYAAGAATSPDPEIFAWAALQVRYMLEATQRLGGANYVLWGGREGYDTLLNTDLARELDQLARFMTMVVEHKHRIGFRGAILIEPKPHEPAKHQYDRDVATVYGFLKRYGLEGEIAVNVEANHATLAGNSFEHEIATAVALGIFGSIDINRGDL